MATQHDNAEISRQEAAAFMAEVPERYFAYHAGPQLSPVSRQIGQRITTWTGDLLANVVWTGNVYVSGFGDQRQNFRARAINGATYSGTAYLDAGDYVRMRRVAT